MKEKRSLHMQVQEHCDCYATTDPLKEMSTIGTETDKNEAGIKWLALAALHGVNSGAKKISITANKKGEVDVEAKYYTSNLPAPDIETASSIVTAVKEITHLEDTSGKTKLALGIRDSSLDLTVKVSIENDSKRVTIKFPPL
ncbi:MAG: hypothetical protein HKM93_19705 [Desulfobacteraceae bacterium]|nr:hypothetical protein [Desulfobacteraceae bacterium]